MKDKEWLKFEEVNTTLRTKVFNVRAKMDGSILGVVKWYGPWRHYCFFQVESNEGERIVWSDRCLSQLSMFITRLNIDHKAEKAGD